MPVTLPKKGAQTVLAGSKTGLAASPPTCALPPPTLLVLPLQWSGEVRLEEATLPLGQAAGFEPIGVMVNQQNFTKTANIYGVSNNKKGTNSNRIVLFRKPA